MEIGNIKINGVKDPVGFELNNIILSYCVEGTPEGKFEVRIYDSPEKDRLLYSEPLDYRENYASKLDFTPEKETRYYFEIVCGKACSELHYFETGTTFDAPFVLSEKAFDHPVIFRSFSSAGAVKARLYVTGLGLYEARLNGERVGEEYLTPGCNDYSAYVQYQTYDITSLLQGEDLLEIALGNGWYKGRFGLNHCSNIYGRDFICAAKIVLWDKDGKKSVLATDETWRSRPSEIVASGIYDGETADLTRKTGESCGVVRVPQMFRVTERISLPVVVKERIKPVLIVSPKGERILDFGQNFSGFVSFRCAMKRGQRVCLRAGEVLQEGCFYRDNLRTAKAEYNYISDGVLREVYPKFTFFGFRYMCVEGLDTVDPADFTGNVLYSDLDETAFVSTGESKMDRLLLNCKWGQKSNFVDVPTTSTAAIWRSIKGASTAGSPLIRPPSESARNRAAFGVMPRPSSRGRCTNFTATNISF